MKRCIGLVAVYFLSLLLDSCVERRLNTETRAVVAGLPTELGVLVFPDGSRFQTTLYELEGLGELRTVNKVPYFILAGRGCMECDANTSIYIHSPSDGQMGNEGTQTRYAHPGRLANYLDGTPVYEARMFFGDCAAARPNAAVWFQRTFGNDQAWHSSVFVVQVTDDVLVEAELDQSVPDISEAINAVRNETCTEVRGIDGTTEP